jgi:hypothetical protein
MVHLVSPFLCFFFIVIIVPGEFYSVSDGAPLLEGYDDLNDE